MFGIPSRKFLAPPLVRSHGAASSCAARARLSVAIKEDRVRKDGGGSMMGAEKKEGKGKRDYSS